MLMNNLRDLCIIKIPKYFSVSDVVLQQQCVTARHYVSVAKIRLTTNRLPFLELQPIVAT
jgi:hypothetical protein